MKSILFILLSCIILSSCYSQDTILKDYVREPFHIRPMPKVPTIPYNKDSVFIKMWSGCISGAGVQYYAILYTLNEELYFANRNLFDFEDFDFRYNKPLYKAKIRIDSTKIPFEIIILDNSYLEINYNYIKNDTLIVLNSEYEELDKVDGVWAIYCTPIDSLLQPLVEINTAMRQAYDADSNTIGRWYNHKYLGSEWNIIQLELIRNNNDLYIDSIEEDHKTILSKDIFGNIIINEIKSMYNLGKIKINNNSAIEDQYGDEIIHYNFMPFDKYYYNNVLHIGYYKTDTTIPSKYYKTP